MRSIIHSVKRNKFAVIAITAFVISLIIISLIFASIFGNGKTEQSENGNFASRLTLGSTFTLDDIKEYLDYDYSGIDKNDKIIIYSVNNENKREPSDKIIERNENGDFLVRGVGKFAIEIIDTTDPTVKIELFEESRFVSSQTYEILSDTYPEITRDALVTCEELLEVKTLSVSKISSLETDDFKYLPSLSRIELISIPSEVITVGELPNEQIKIYVPEYSYEKYMLDKSFDDIGDRVFTLGIEDSSVSVVIHKNGGSTSDDNDLTIDSEFVSASSKIDLGKYTQMKKTGYLLKGIYRLSGTERVYVNENNIYTTDTKLYAEWEAITYQIAFDENVPEGYDVSQNSIKMENTSCEYDVSKALSKSTLDITGWHFVGWSLTPDGVATIKDNGSVKNLSSIKDGCVTLYAKWAKNKYTISFDGNLPETESALDGTMSEAQCTFDSERSLPEIGFKLKGYTFIGWSLSKDGSVAYSDIAVVKNLTTENNKNIILYAKWRPNKYTVSFDVNAPQGSSVIQGSMSDAEYTYDLERHITAHSFKITGWHFLGWSTSPNGSVKYENFEVIKNLTAVQDGSVTLYAKWERNHYDIVFNSNAPAGYTLTGGSTATMDCKYGVASNLIKNGFEITGWHFLGWATSPNGNVEYADKASVENLTTSNGGKINLYAKWAINTYSIRFDVGTPEGFLPSGSMSSVSCVYDKGVTIPQNTYKVDGWTFAGWSRTKGGSVEFQNADTVKNLTAINGHAITLYAVWRVDPYTIAKCVPDGKQFASSDGTTYMVYTNPKTVPKSISANYVIFDWSSVDSTTVDSAKSPLTLSNLKELYLIGKATDAVYSSFKLNVNMAPTVNSVKIHLKNFNMKGYIASLNPNNNAEFEAKGISLIEAYDTSAIYGFQRLVLSGDTLYVGGGNGRDATNYGENGYDGYAGISAYEVDIKMSGSLNVYGGDGGDGSSGIDGRDGRSYGSGKDENWYWNSPNGENGQHGGRGGNGGRGASAIEATNVNAYSGIIKLYGGNSGDAGNGGSGGNGGRGGDADAIGATSGNGGNGGNGGRGGDAYYGANAILGTLYKKIDDASVSLGMGSAGLIGHGGYAGSGGSAGAEGAWWFDGAGIRGQDGYNGASGLLLPN